MAEQPADNLREQVRSRYAQAARSVLASGSDSTAGCCGSAADSGCGDREVAHESPGAAYWFTASTAFANPAVTIGRTLTATYAGIAPSSVPAFIAAQAGGGTLGALLAVIIYPGQRAPVADRRVPHAATDSGGAPA
ncbi:MAG TPA: hypothetical protein VGG35_02685 [Streptosporangiaceae bacterium]|jgi:hypothetical protein